MKAERWIQRWHRYTEKHPALHSRQQRSSKHQRKQRRKHPSRNRAGASRTHEQLLSLKLQPMERPHVSLAYPLDRLQLLARDRPASEARVQFLCGNRRGGQRNVDADRPGRTHRVSRVSDQQQTISRPVSHQTNDALEREKRLQVLQPCGEILEDGIKLPHAIGNRCDSLLAPALPFARRQRDARLNVMRVLGQNQTTHMIPKRDVKSWIPAARLLDREPYEVEVVMLVVRR